MSISFVNKLSDQPSEIINGQDVFNLPHGTVVQFYNDYKDIYCVVMKEGLSDSKGHWYLAHLNHSSSPPLGNFADYYCCRLYKFVVVQANLEIILKSK